MVTSAMIPVMMVTGLLQHNNYVERGMLMSYGLLFPPKLKSCKKIVVIY
jgi:hypothetical protein